MPKLETKQAVVQEIKTKLDKAKSVVLADARGLTVEQDTALRKTLRAVGVDYKVYKNSLLNIAIQGTEFSELEKFLSGPTAVAISYADATTAASTISKQLKMMPQLEFKAGVVERVTYDAAGMQIIAEIPPREELLSKLLGSLKAPMASFARLINAAAEKRAEA
ncbi:MAG: 50S ribosomal protein L10 [Clostridiales bacterium]|jgi:large subunit ribosomal protein L10|nr:50S ribosomal protein L10 [Clostridiales bacterium]